MIIETERLILRPWQESDAEECYRYASDPRVGIPCGWEVHTSVEYSRRIIRKILAREENYAVVLRETGLPVGSIGLLLGNKSNYTESANQSEIGYWLGVPYWGRGLIPEAASALIDHAFRDLGFEKLWCVCLEENERSWRVMEKCGFTFDRTTKDAKTGETMKVAYLSRENWEKNRLLNK